MVFFYHREREQIAGREVPGCYIDVPEHVATCVTLQALFFPLTGHTPLCAHRFYMKLQYDCKSLFLTRGDGMNAEMFKEVQSIAESLTLSQIYSPVFN